MDGRFWLPFPTEAVHTNALPYAFLTLGASPGTALLADQMLVAHLFQTYTPTRPLTTLRVVI